MSRSTRASPRPRSSMTKMAGCAASPPAIWGSPGPGEPGPNYQPGMELHAKLTLLAEGCRGSLSKVAMARFGLREGVQPQTYGLGVKELWEIDPARHQTRAGRPHHRLADDRPYLWRLLALHVRGEPGLDRLRRRARLRQSEPVAVRGDAALQDAPGDPPLFWKAGGESPTARGPCPRAASSRSRSWCSRAVP